MPTVARNHTYVCKEQLIPMDNTAQQTVEMRKLLAHMVSMLEVAKKTLFAELKEETTMESYALEYAHLLAQLTKF